MRNEDTRGKVWVKPHTRNGRSIKGHWRKVKGKKDAYADDMPYSEDSWRDDENESEEYDDRENVTIQQLKTLEDNGWEGGVYNTNGGTVWQKDGYTIITAENRGDIYCFYKMEKSPNGTHTLAVFDTYMDQDAWLVDSIDDRPNFDVSKANNVSVITPEREFNHFKSVAWAEKFVEEHKETTHEWDETEEEEVKLKKSSRGNPRSSSADGLIYDDAIGDWRFSTQDERDLMAEDEERERLERIKKQRKQRELDEIESIMMKKEAKDKIKRKKNPFYKNNK